MSEYIKVKERPVTFIKKKHDLKELLKLVGKETEAAVRVLADAMNDEKEDKKVRRECAKTLIDLKISVAEAVDRSEMQRMIAEIKINPNAAKSLEAEDDFKRPVLDFNTIRVVE